MNYNDLLRLMMNENWLADEGYEKAAVGPTS